MKGYIIADDLSGGLEAGAAYRMRGYRVTLPLNEEISPVVDDEIRVLATETRNLRPAEARGRLTATLTALRTQGAKVLFKKIDSTLRGPVGAELQVMREILAPPLIVLCPANPAVGRTVREGLLRVDGVPVADTDFAHDAIWPSRTSDVRELLAQQGIGTSGALSLRELRAGSAAVAGSVAHACESKGRILISDAETMDDLEQLVQVVSATVPTALFVGSGALAKVLAADGEGGGSPRRPLPVAETALSRPIGWVVICGSRHEATRRQLEYLAAQRCVPVRRVVAGKSEVDAEIDAAVDALNHHPTIAVYFASADDLNANVASLVLEAVTTFVTHFHPRMRHRGYFLTGGETAWAVCRALSGRWLEVDKEKEPGVVAATLYTGRGDRVSIVTKPGGFGDEALLERWVK